MVSCENLLSESSELFGGVPENHNNSSNAQLLSSSLKSSIKSSGSGFSNSSRKMYRSGGGIFSNPFKSDSEKMDLLTDLLKQYRESGIPETGHHLRHNPHQPHHHHSTHQLLHSQSHCQSTNKLNHLRASSLSISGFTGTGSSSNQAVSPTAITASNTSGNSPGFLSTNKTSLSTTDLHHLNHSLSQISPNQPNQPPQTSSSFDASDDASYLYLEPEWGSIVEGADQLPGRVKSQNEAIWELLQTEVFYIRRLKVVNDIFVACLLNLQSECILNEVGQFNSNFIATLSGVLLNLIVVVVVTSWSINKSTCLLI